MGKLPKKIQIEVTHNGHGVSGAFVKIRFPMKQKNDYWLMFGPGNSKGKVSVDREQILIEAKKEQSLFLMDYADLESEMTGEYLIKFVDILEVDKAIEAYELFHDVTEYSPNHLAALKRFRQELERLGTGTIKTKISFS